MLHRINWSSPNASLLAVLKRERQGIVRPNRAAL